jgi:branched-chain amino acid transport system substrate-binding protein
MSAKNETTIFFLSLLITLGLLGIGIWWLKDKIWLKTTNNQELQERISFGEKSFLKSNSVAKKEAIAALKAGNFPQAVSNLETALQLQKNDPEALIFLNNARIGSKKSYAIATCLPLGTDVNGSLEILRGIAQAQNEINAAGGIKGIPLKVGIANDDNNPEIAKQIAKVLVENEQILGVVGHFTSDVTLAAGTVYTSGKLVAISPTSTSVKISNFSPYVFRTVPNDFIAARALAKYMVENLRQKNVAVFFNSESGYSQSLKSEFVSSVSLEGGQVFNEFDFSQPDFSAAKSVDQAAKEGAKVLMLASDTNTLDKALQVVQLNQKRFHLLAGDDVYTLKTLEIGREQAAGMVLAVAWHIDAFPKSNFLRQSRKLWGADVSWRTALSYDATIALIEALKINPTRAGVQKALLAPNFSPTGASGSIRFLLSGDRNAFVQLVKIIPRNPSRSGTGFDFVPISLLAAKKSFN